MAKTAAELLDEEPTASQLLDAEEEGAPAQKLTERDGVKHLELHKTAPDLSEPEAPPEEDKPGLLKQIAKAVGVPTELKDLAPETTAGAFGHGVQKGATLGFGDELTGLLEGPAKRREQADKMLESVAEAKRTGTYDPSAAAPDIPGVTSYQLKRPGEPTLTKTAVAKSPTDAETPQVTPWADAYRQARDSMREQYATAEKAHPVAFTGGELFGGAAVPLPGVGKAKGLAKAGKYALQGAGLGAVAGLGTSNDDLTQGEAPGALADTARGAAGGAAFGGVLGGVAAKLDPWLEKMSARRAYKAMEPYMETIREGLEGRFGRAPRNAELMAEAERQGRRMLDEGIIPEGVVGRWANAEDIADNASRKLEEAGQLKGAFVDHAQDELAKAGVPNPVSRGRLATEIEQAAEQAGIDGNQDLKRQLLRQARNERQTIVDRAAAGFDDPAAQTLQDAEKYKTKLQKRIDFGAPLERREAQTAVQRLAKQQTEKAIEGGLGPDELDQFKALKNRYGDLSTISQTADYGAKRAFRNNVAGPGDKLAAVAGAAATGGPAAIPIAAASAAAHHIANHRGSAALARTLSNAANRTSVALTPGAEYLAEPADEEPWKSLKGE